MPDFKVFRCPSCGGSISTDGETATVLCQFCGNTAIVPEAMRVKRPTPPPAVGSYMMPPVVITSTPMMTNADAGRARSWITWLVVIIVLAIVCPIIATIGATLLGAGASIAAIIPIMRGVEGFSTAVLSTAIAAETAQPAATELPGFATVTLSFGGEGTGAGKFQDPRAIAVDTQGNVYVGEYTLGRVQKFDSGGNFVNSWVPEGENPLLSMAADRQGNVYATRQGWILKHNAETGEQVARLVTDGYVGNVAVLPNGNLVAFQSGGRSDDLIFLDAQGQELSRATQVVSGPGGGSVSFVNMTVDGLGNIYIASMSHSAVFRYTPEGQFIDRFGSEGDQPGQFTVPQAIAVDSQGRIYVSDFKGIQVFTNDGQYLDVFDIPTGGVSGLAFSIQDDLYATSNNNEVYKFQLTNP